MDLFLTRISFLIEYFHESKLAKFLNPFNQYLGKDKCAESMYHEKTTKWLSR
jgi:hypothetical protein